VALTFDAEHPSRAANDPDAPEAILDALGAADVRGTFFVQGRWASAYPDVARRMASDGHLIGNHSHYHARLSLLSPAGVRADVEAAGRRITEVTGVDPKPWFRCPFGDGAERPEVREALRALGYRNVDWNVDSGDWCDGASPEGVRATVVDGAQGIEDGSVMVLFHTWTGATARSLPAILADLRSDGASFVTAAEVLW